MPCHPGCQALTRALPNPASIVDTVSMINAQNKFYITTAIDYPNSAPHMGHAYEKVLADFYARAHRLRGIDTRFLIGLDEHGQKIQEAAKKDGKAPQDFVDEKAKIFVKLYDLLEISYDDFIRTTEPRHHEFVRDIYLRARDRGDIYKGIYQGDYCVSCEKAYTKSELVDGACPIHSIPTTVVEEESYFFRLGKYRDAIRTHIESHPEFVHPTERRNEILARLRDEVLDLSISRSTFQWGIPLPDDPSHVVYVWFDALSNYISALEKPQDNYGRYWPAECHVIGKDIIWFHSVIWPAMLLSAGHALPRQIYAHGFILDKDGRKMSKQLGNVVDPLQVAKEYSVDVLRFYLLRAFSSGSDGNFCLEELEERYESELGNDLGNLVLRIAKLVCSRLGGTIETPGLPADLDPSGTIQEFFQQVDGREHQRAVEALWAYIRRTNAYLTEKKPWKIEEESELKRVLGCGLEALRVAAYLLEPVMPATARAIGGSLGFEIRKLSDLSSGPASYRVTLEKALFPRREKKVAAGAAPGAPGPQAAQGAGPTDPFAKLEIRVAYIEEAMDHPNADALFAMTVDVGGEKRSICAGLREYLTADDLRGRKAIVLANLKPLQLRGIESRGMILATDRRDGKVVPVDPGDAKVGELVTVEGIESKPKSKISMSEFEKAPLEMQGGAVTYRGKALRTSAGPIRCDAQDGSKVR